MFVTTRHHSGCRVHTNGIEADLRPHRRGHLERMNAKTALLPLFLLALPANADADDATSITLAEKAHHPTCFYPDLRYDRDTRLCFGQDTRGTDTNPAPTAWADVRRGFIRRNGTGMAGHIHQVSENGFTVDASASHIDGTELVTLYGTEADANYANHNMLHWCCGNSDIHYFRFEGISKPGPTLFTLRTTSLRTHDLARLPSLVAAWRQALVTIHASGSGAFRHFDCRARYDQDSGWIIEQRTEDGWEPV